MPKLESLFIVNDYLGTQYLSDSKPKQEKAYYEQATEQNTDIDLLIDYIDLQYWAEHGEHRDHSAELINTLMCSCGISLEHRHKFLIALLESQK